MLGAQFRMSDGFRLVDDINPHGNHLHGSVPSFFDETLTSALSALILVNSKLFVIKVYNWCF